MRDDIEVLLQKSLSPALAPAPALNEKLLKSAAANTGKIVEFKPKKAVNRLVKAAIIVLAVFGLASASVTAANYIYSHFFVSNKVGFVYGDEEDLEVFEQDDESYTPTYTTLLEDDGDETVNWYYKTVIQNDEDTVRSQYYYKNYAEMVEDASLDEWFPRPFTDDNFSFANFMVVVSPGEVFSTFDVLADADFNYNEGSFHICETYSLGTDKDPETFGYNVYIENPTNIRSYTNKNSRNFVLADSVMEDGSRVTYTSLFYPTLHYGYISFYELSDREIYEILDMFVEPKPTEVEFVFPEKPGVLPVTEPVKGILNKAKENE